MNKFVVTIIGKKVQETKVAQSEIFLSESKVDYKILSSHKNHLIVEIFGKIYNLVYSKKGNDNFQILINGQTFETEILTNLQYQAKQIIAEKKRNSGEEVILAPMPGLILKITKNVGDFVQEEDALFVLEAMKMENEIKAPKSGKIKEIKVKSGDSVQKGTEILIIE